MTDATLHIVHTESSCGWGGQEIRILSESRGLIRRGHRVRLVCVPGSNIQRAAAGYGVEAVALPIERKRLGPCLALRRWLAREGGAIDVLNTHSSTDSWLAALACAALRDPPPIVRTRHVSSPIGRGRATFWLYQRAARHVVTAGEALREQLVRENGFAADSITSVPTGIDLERFRPRGQEEVRRAIGLPPHVPLVGILATLRDWKGHEFLFEALARLRPDHPELRAIVIGEGPYRPKLEARVAALDVGDRVSFVGQRDHPEYWLNALDVFALPSYGDEGLSQALMQAMACALPVITTPIGAHAEVVRDGDTGLLVPARDAAALAAAIARLLADEALRARLGVAAHRFAAAHCGEKAMLDRMEALFQRFARRR
ncbi:MAG: glycosyltransferase family 4 protein [Betaproteobacteria bacterium]|nr:glycosyltransferase family 4 protein [Betaproteobacteria bacterium]